MKTLLAAMAVMVIVGLGSVAIAQDQPAPKHQRINDKIVSADDAGILVQLNHGDKDVTIITGPSTRVTLDKNPAKVSDLKVGLFVQVVYVRGQPATGVRARTQPPTHRHGGNAPAELALVP